MKVLLIGGKGSIGTRYKIILDTIGVETKIYDYPNDQVIPGCLDHLDFDKAIIASPTETHAPWAEVLYTMGKKFLCEKPICKITLDCKTFESWGSKHPSLGFVVNNYAFVKSYQLKRSTCSVIHYNYFNTGKDGLLWDLCQLVHIATKEKKMLNVSTNSYHWTLDLDGQPIAYRELEDSYYKMIQAFILGNERNLWTVFEGIKMTREVQHCLTQGTPKKGFSYNGKTGTLTIGENHEGDDWDSSPKRIFTSSKQNLQGSRTENDSSVGLGSGEERRKTS